MHVGREAGEAGRAKPNNAEMPSPAQPWIASLKWDENGLIPAIAQDATSGRVLMFAWMNRESLEESLRSGNAVYWSRSRQRLWRKGEESGHFQKLLALRTDCDSDVLLLAVEQVGGQAHRASGVDQVGVVGVEAAAEGAVRQPQVLHRIALARLAHGVAHPFRVHAPARCHVVGKGHGLGAAGVAGHGL